MPGPAKYLTLDATTASHKEAAFPIASPGSGGAGLPVGLNGNGQIDLSFFPPELGVQTARVPATEALAAGAFVNLYGSGAGNTTFSARNADASTNKPAHGFVRVAVASGAIATVNVDGVNDALSGLAPGKYFLGAIGAATQTLPSGTGTLLQPLGTALSATQLDFQPGQGTVLA